MLKRGQVTIFLIIGIIILALFATILFITSTIQKEELQTQAEEFPSGIRAKTPVRTFVENCLEETALPGIYLMGIQGGVIYPDDPQLILLTENALINYGYLNGVDQISKKKMEADLNRFLEESLPSCLDFELFTAYGIEVLPQGNLEANTKIRNQEVSLNLKYPVDVIIGNDITRLENFFFKIPVRLGEVVDEVKQIIKEYENDLVNANLYFESSQDHLITLFPHDENTLVYSISDDNSVINDAPFTFMFALRDDNINSPPELDYITDFTLLQGSEFTYQLTALDPEDHIMTFSSDSSVIPVDDGGFIEKTFNEPGTHTVTFTVQDFHGLEDSQEVRFVIESE